MEKTEEKQAITGKVVVVIDVLGRKLIGQIHAGSARDVASSNTVVLYDPAIYVEKMTGETQVAISMVPVDLVNAMDYMCVAWAQIYDVTASISKSSYEDFVIKFKAAKAGITIAASIPKNLRQPVAAQH